MTLGDFLTVGTSLVGVILVIFLAYYASKWLNTRLAPGGQTRGIKVLDKMFISQNKALMIVQVGGKFLLVSLADKQITKLCDLEAEDVSELLERAKIQESRGAKPILPPSFFGKGKKEDVPFSDYLNNAYKNGEKEEKLK